MSDKLNLVIEFSSQNRAVVSEVEHDLSSVSVSLSNLALQARSTGAAVAAAQNQINHFANTLQGNFMSVVTIAENAMRRLYGLASLVAKISFATFIAEIAGLGVALRRVTADFIEVNQKFASMQITMASAFRSLAAARKIRDEIVNVTQTSPIPFQGISDLLRAYSVLPYSRGQIVQQTVGNNLGDQNGFFRKGIQLAEMMLAYRPDKTINDAVFSIREALTGEFRSVIRRFSVPSASIVAQAGEPLAQLKANPEKIFNTLFDYFSKIISPGAISQLIRQPDILKQNLKEQAYEIPLLKIGDSGLYKTTVDFFVKVYQDVLDFTTKHMDDYAKRISDALTGSFKSVTASTGNLVENLLGRVGLGKTDHPEMSLIQRSYEAVTRGIEAAATKLPEFAAKAEKFLETLIPLLVKMAEFFTKIGSFFVDKFTANPILATLETGLLIELPSLFGRAGKAAATSFFAGISKDFTAGQAAGATARFSAFPGVGAPSNRSGSSSGVGWLDALGLSSSGRSAQKTAAPFGRDLSQLIEQDAQGRYKLIAGAEKYLTPEEMWHLGGGAANGKNSLVSNYTSFMGSNGFSGRRKNPSGLISSEVGEGIMGASSVLAARGGLAGGISGAATGVLEGGAALLTDVVLPFGIAVGIFAGGAYAIQKASEHFAGQTDNAAAAVSAKFNTPELQPENLAKIATQVTSDASQLSKALQADLDLNKGKDSGQAFKIADVAAQQAKIVALTADIGNIRKLIDSKDGSYSLQSSPGTTLNRTQGSFTDYLGSFFHRDGQSTSQENLTEASRTLNSLIKQLAQAESSFAGDREFYSRSLPSGLAPKFSKVLSPVESSNQDTAISKAGEFTLDNFLGGNTNKGSSVDSLASVVSLTNNINSDENIGAETEGAQYLKQLHSLTDPAKESRESLLKLTQDSGDNLRELNDAVVSLQGNLKGAYEAAKEQAAQMVPAINTLKSIISLNPGEATSKSQAMLTSIQGLYSGLDSGGIIDGIIKKAQDVLQAEKSGAPQARSTAFAKQLNEIITALQKSSPEEGQDIIAPNLSSFKTQFKSLGLDDKTAEDYTAQLQTSFSGVSIPGGLSGDELKAAHLKSAESEKSVYDIAQKAFSGASDSPFSVLSNYATAQINSGKNADANIEISANQRQAFADLPSVLSGSTSIGKSVAGGNATANAQDKLSESIDAFKTLGKGGLNFPPDAISVLNKNLTIDSDKPSQIGSLVEKYKDLADIYPVLISSSQDYLDKLDKTADAGKYQQVSALIDKLISEQESNAKRLNEIVGPGFGSSLLEGFTGVTEKWKETASNFTQVGAEAADTVSSHFNTFFGNVISGNKNLGRSFQQMIGGILSSVSSAFASKAFQSLFGSLVGGVGNSAQGVAGSGLLGLFGGSVARAGGGSSANFGGNLDAGVSSPISESAEFGSFAGGGVVSGGSGMRDDVPAMLTGGEYVIPRSVVQSYGTDHFENYTSGGFRGYAKGGSVGGVSVPASPLSHVDNSQIHITVNGDGGGASSSQNGSNSTQEAERNQRRLADQLRAMVVDVINNNKRNGGAFSKTSN